MRQLLLITIVLLTACSAPNVPTSPVQNVQSATPSGPPPQITAVTADHTALGRYERLELTVDLKATFENPYDPDQVALAGEFTAPSGTIWNIDGFWDGHQHWRMRFTPAEVGTWQYRLTLRDANGTSRSAPGQFEVAASARHGWVQVASWVNPQLSPRYLAYHDGTPFYGVGYCEAFTLVDARLDTNGDLNSLKKLRENGGNLVVWWPHYSFTFFQQSPHDFDRIDMELIDQYLASAERLGVTVVYTIWDHPQLRGAGHPWGAGNWGKNGFRTITPDAKDFFTSEDSWKAQEQFYRYLIARWGYSPAIIWQTVSELNGTSVGAARDTWHARINQYFVEHDPYRHPTTASLSGDQDWPEGFAVMDLPQVHLYEQQHDPVKMGDSVAEWTARMWRYQARPNLVGEFGGTRSANEVALLHNGLWAGLASGAAITPLRWNDRNTYGRMREPMLEQIRHFSTFVNEIPFAQRKFEPARLQVSTDTVVAHGLADQTFALAWVQARTDDSPRDTVQLSITGLATGSYTVRTYNTWTGQDFAQQQAQSAGDTLTITLPEFTRDLAVMIVPAGE